MEFVAESLPQSSGDAKEYEFEALLELQEEEDAMQQPNVSGSQGQQQASCSFLTCPLERNCFKLRRNRRKRVIVVIRQTSGPAQLVMRKCFGFLLAAGRHLRQSDMHLLEVSRARTGQNQQSQQQIIPSANSVVNNLSPNNAETAPAAGDDDASSTTKRAFVVEANWNPNAPNFEVLNTETPKETRVFLTIAVDMIFVGLSDPLRFSIECRARVFQQFERFWHIEPRRAHREHFILVTTTTNAGQQKPQTMDNFPVASTVGGSSGDPLASSNDNDDDQSRSVPSASHSGGCGGVAKVLRFESQTEQERFAAAWFFETILKGGKLTNLVLPVRRFNSTDSDEPLLSGSGDVNRDCPEDVLAEWRRVIDLWKDSFPGGERPPEINALLKDGCPDVLRVEVWPMLANAQLNENIEQTYRMLLEKECPSEAVILRDLHRTFPAHKFFSESNGAGQAGLYRLSKAYSLYDEEVSYCQGLSFLAAALLLHMPEENAFALLTKIMYDYGMRDHYKLGFDVLYIRFYQLQRLIQDYAFDLHLHFSAIGVETQMYASQWFLTLFTAKFPIQMVFYVLDLFLAQGIQTTFHIALALLQDARKELLQLDFESVLKYFRVALPRRYRTDQAARKLIQDAVKLKISHKRLQKYEREWYEQKQRELESQDPVERLERENCRFKTTILRLERENDELAHELVVSKIELRNTLDTTEDQLEHALATVESRTREYKDLAEQNERVKEEIQQLKALYRQEVGRLEAQLRQTDAELKDLTRQRSVNEEYKRICSNLGHCLDRETKQFSEQKRQILSRISSRNCDGCLEAVNELFSNDSTTVHQSPRSSNNRKQMNGGVHSENGSNSPSREGTPQPGAENNSEGSRCRSQQSWDVCDLLDQLEDRDAQIRQMELELAQTKLALVETQCQNQDLAHQISASMSRQSSVSHQTPAWLKKTIQTVKDVNKQLQHAATPRQNANEANNNNVTSHQQQKHHRTGSNISSISTVSNNSSNPTNNGTFFIASCPASQIQNNR